MASPLPLQLKRLYKKCTLPRVIALILVYIVLWNEYIGYFVATWNWQILRSKGHKGGSTEALRVLFVADPQLIGLKDENHFLGPITRWDSDRYLHKTFEYAVWHHEPEVIVFMGDLLDEGSIANPTEYQSYMERFYKVFPKDPNIPHIYIPGDNDIGGEGFEPKTERKIATFNTNFLKDQYPPKNVVKMKFIDFLRLQINAQEVVQSRISRDLDALAKESTAPYRILINHESIIDRYSNDQNDVIRITQADFLFSAHVHISSLHICNDCLDENPSNRRHKAFTGVTKDIVDNRVYHFDMKDKRQMYEIVVPTCSYRMGVGNMGYGAAYFDNSGHVQYTVLWQPSRYLQLALYVIILSISALILILWVGYYIWSYCVQPIWVKYLRNLYYTYLHNTYVGPLYTKYCLPINRMVCKPIWLKYCEPIWLKIFLPIMNKCISLIKYRR